MFAEMRRLGQFLAMIAGSKTPDMQRPTKSVFVIIQAENPLVMLRFL